MKEICTICTTLFKHSVFFNDSPTPHNHVSSLNSVFNKAPVVNLAPLNPSNIHYLHTLHIEFFAPIYPAALAVPLVSPAA